MKTAFIFLPRENTPVEGSFSNLNGFWIAPPRVKRFWKNCCEVEYIDEQDYTSVKEWVQVSYHECIKSFYKENAL